MRSAWLRGAAPAGGVGSNGRPGLAAADAFLACLRRGASEAWAHATLYAPLELLRAHPLRAEKYFWATVCSIELLERLCGAPAAASRHLHRHSALTCYLDALVDAHVPLEWAVAFGRAVFGLGPRPAHHGECDAATRRCLDRDWPLLRLMVAGEAGRVIVPSLLEAAAVERDRAALCPLEYKLLSNLVCVRPFLRGAVGDGLMEPLAMVYTFFDDSFDVAEDGPGSHMATEAGIRRAEGLARAALTELNGAFREDCSAAAEALVRVAGAAARLQLAAPDDYLHLESAAPRLCVKLAVTFFALVVTSRRTAATCTRCPSRFVPGSPTTSPTTA